MHYNEEDLILYYYGEHRRREQVEQHLTGCTACAAMYRDIVGSLGLVGESEPPARSDDYGREVWLRIRHKLPEQEPAWWAVWMHPQRLAAAGGIAVLVLAAFVAGRMWTGPGRAPGSPRAAATFAGAPSHTAPASPDGPAATSIDAGERVRLAAIGDHLEQSERILLDIINANGTGDGPADVSNQQEWAADLIAANRLYRDASTAAGDDAVVVILDELERNLLDIVHGPASLTPAELDQIRIRLDAAALLFRVRVLSDELRVREFETITPRKTT